VAALHGPFPARRPGHCPKDLQQLVGAAIRPIFRAANLEEARRLLDETVTHLEGRVPKVARLLLEAEPDLLAFYAFPAAHHSKLRSTDERFKAPVDCRSAGTELASWSGVVDPGAKSRVVGLGALPRSLPLEGPTVAPQWWRPRPLRSGRHWGLVAGRLGCHPATSWR
jgi:Transposase, Mutator family